MEVAIWGGSRKLGAQHKPVVPIPLGEVKGPTANGAASSSLVTLEQLGFY